MRNAIVTLVASVLLAGCSVFGIRSGYEQPRYDVVDRLTETVEVRRYAPRVVAEAIVEAAYYEEGQNAAFKLLFDYISGANRTDARISMTTPVETSQMSNSIEMAVPVETARALDGRVRMRFFLPATYDAQSAPQPLEPQLRIIVVPAEYMAVLRFSGFVSEDRINAKTGDLLGVLDNGRWRSASATVSYLYDPPWTLPFFRRNEVAIEVVPMP